MISRYSRLRGMLPGKALVDGEGVVKDVVAVLRMRCRLAVQVRTGGNLG